jgi:hypothetical protein
MQGWTRQSVTLVEGSYGLSTGAFQSFFIPPTINPAFDDGVGKGCGFIIFDDAALNCTGAPENVIAPDLGLGKCVPSLLFGNFAGPLPAQAITLQCVRRSEFSSREVREVAKDEGGEYF